MNFTRLSLFVNQCTTIQYVNSLKVACDTLREIIAILGPIRVDSVEGGNGLKVTPPPSTSHRLSVPQQRLSDFLLFLLLTTVFKGEQAKAILPLV
jgi:hypothetical protein